MASGTTAAATGAVGVVRRDPMAMLPFCGYNMEVLLWSLWLRMGERLAQPPLVFRVNWFRTDESGQFLWPGFGEPLRVLRWVLGRVHGEIGAAETALGYLPHPADIDVDELKPCSYRRRCKEMFPVDGDGWMEAVEANKRRFFFCTKFGARLPRAMWPLPSEALAHRHLVSQSSPYPLQLGRG